MLIEIPKMTVTSTVNASWFKKVTPFGKSEEELREENLDVEYVSGKYSRDGQASEFKAIFRDPPHFNAVRQQLFRRFHEDPFSETHFAYRETITKEETQEGIFVRQPEFPGHFAHVILTVSPIARQHAILFTTERNALLEEIMKEPLPRNGIEEELNAMCAGIRQEALCGGPRGYPILGIEIKLRAAGMHLVDTMVSDFKIAAQIAFRNAIQQGSFNLFLQRL
jgi:elongation factor G